MLQGFQKESRTSDIVAALEKDGGVIVADLVDHKLIDTVAAELRPHFDE